MTGLPLFQGMTLPPAERHDPGSKVRLRLPRDVTGSAVFSPCGRYRLRLERQEAKDFNPARPAVLWCMMNPSTADHTVNDRTIGRCWSFTYGWGYRRLIVWNAFAYRATKPKTLLAVEDPVGPDNDATLLAILGERIRNLLVIAAWGSLPPPLAARGEEVRNLLATAGVPLRVLHLNADGSPGHPLYVPSNIKPVEWPHDLDEA